MEYSGKSQLGVHSSIGVDAARAERVRALSECGEIAATRLAIALSDALNAVVDQLFAKGVQEALSPDQQSWLEAANFVRTRRYDMVDAFTKHFEERYGAACRRKPGRVIGHLRDIDASQLKIVEHDDLEYAVNPEVLVEAIRNGTWLTLPELTKWFKNMLADQELLPVDMPLGPKLLSDAIAHAVNEQFGKPESKQRMMRALCRPLSELVNRFYQDMTQHLTRGEPLSGVAIVPSRNPLAQPANSAPGALPGGSPGQADGKAVSPTEAPVVGEIPPASMIAAGEAIDRRLEDIRLPRFVADFLRGPWHSLLGRIHGQGGQSCREWDDSLRTMDDLIRSLRTRKSPEACSRLTQELPDLAKRLVQGLEMAGESADAHDGFFKRLAEYHIRILGKFGPVSLSATQQAPAASVPVEAGTAADSTPVAPGSGLEGIGATDSVLDAIEVGAWLEFHESERMPRKLKLAWISPSRNLFLLTNHLGERALSLGSRDLASLLLEGGARIVQPADAPVAKDTAAPASQDKKIA